MSLRNNIVPLSSHRKPHEIAREGAYVTERLISARGCLIHNLRVSTTVQTPGGEKDEMHHCSNSDRHFTHVRIVDVNQEGLVGQCGYCQGTIENLMEKLDPECVAFFKGEMETPPYWIDKRPA